MYLYRIKVNDVEAKHEVYTGFIVTANSINTALEVVYSTVVKPENDIPYYLRSSNMKIEKISQINNVENKEYENCVLMSQYNE